MADVQDILTRTLDALAERAMASAAGEPDPVADANLNSQLTMLRQELNANAGGFGGTEIDAPAALDRGLEPVLRFPTMVPEVTPAEFAPVEANTLYLAVCVDGTTLPTADDSHTAGVSGNLGYPYIDCVNADNTPLIPGPTRTAAGAYIPTIVLPQEATIQPWPGGFDGSPYDLATYSASDPYNVWQIEVRLRVGSSLTTSPASLPIYVSLTPYHKLPCDFVAYPYAAGDYENGKFNLIYSSTYQLTNRKVTVCRGVLDKAGGDPAKGTVGAYPYPQSGTFIHWASPETHGWMEFPMHRIPILEDTWATGNVLVYVSPSAGNDVLWVPPPP